MGAQFNFYLLMIIVQGTIGKRLVTFVDIKRVSGLLNFAMKLGFITLSVKTHIIKPSELLGQDMNPRVSSPGLI